MKTALTIVTLACLVFAPFIGQRLKPMDYTGGRSQHDAAIEARNASAIAQILGEIRTSMSDLMYMKTERYLHNGVGYAPHIDTGALASGGEIKHATGAPVTEPPSEFGYLQQADEDQSAYLEQKAGKPPEAEAHVEPTIIRTPADDFRLFIGNLERKVKPWRDPSLAHIHSDGTELLPWFRLMTFSDKHYVRGYLIGGYWLLRQRTDTHRREALTFVDEGIANNPKTFQLYLMKGHILRELEREAESRPVYRQACDLGMKARPADARDRVARDDLSWTHYDESDLWSSVRMAIHMEKRYGSLEEAHRLADAIAAQVPADDTIAIIARAVVDLELPAP